MLNTLSFPTGSQLYLGDCLEVLKTLPDESVDLILTDPPYGYRYKSRSRKLPLTTIANDGEEAYELLDQALAIAWRKLKPDRHVYIFTNWQCADKMGAIARKYFKQKGSLAWIKNCGSMGDLKGNYSYRHEEAMYFHKGYRWMFGKRDSDVLFFDKVPSNHMQHPTEKPVPLLKYLIEKSTQPGEVVLDMFMGSGSTCVAAQKAGRRYIGIDSESAWFEVAQARILSP